MGYYLKAFIGSPDVIEKFAGSYNYGKAIKLNDSISIMPFTHEFFDEINKKMTSENILSFEFLTTNIEDSALNLIGLRPIAYIEAEYFGGVGGQMGIIWKDGNRFLEFDYDQGVINSILKYFGVVAVSGLDEFDTLKLGRFRDTIDWIA
jgi:hypothetical protein